jgi:hypothetical protein
MKESEFTILYCDCENCDSFFYGSVIVINYGSGSATAKRYGSYGCDSATLPRWV